MDKIDCYTMWEHFRTLIYLLQYYNKWVPLLCHRLLLSANFVIGHIMSFCSCHFISYHVISSHVMSFHRMSCHLISCHVISYHVISSHIMSFHLISCHFISYHVISSHIMSFHHHVISCVHGLFSAFVFVIYWLQVTTFFLFFRE
jgi:hypothetical protein